MSRTNLPVVSDCEGCGVCCLHMGYPTFIRPRPPRTPDEIQSDPELRELARSARRRQDLLEGHPGEPYWAVLPEDLKDELERFIEGYDDDPKTLDGPCLWFDPKTRQCKHHEYRPRVCRDFQIGSRGCREWREFYRDRILTR